MSGKRRILAGAFAVALGVVAYACWPRAPRLELFTSDPLLYAGKRMRVRVLVPSGWTEFHPDYFYRIDLAKPEVSSRGVIFHPPVSEKPSYLLGWLQRLFSGPPSSLSTLMVFIGEEGENKDHEIHTNESLRRGRIRVFFATRDLPTEPHLYVYYTRTDRAEFEATYRRICNSLKLVPVK